MHSPQSILSKAPKKKQKKMIFFFKSTKIVNQLNAVVNHTRSQFTNLYLSLFAFDMQCGTFHTQQGYDIRRWRQLNKQTHTFDSEIRNSADQWDQKRTGTYALSLKLKMTKFLAGLLLCVSNILATSSPNSASVNSNWSSGLICCLVRSHNS